MMKRFNYILQSVALLAAAGLSACVDDAVVSNSTQQGEQGDTEYFVKLSLKTSDSNFTRADDPASEDNRLGTGLVDGEHNEHDISPDAHNFALFFDNTKNYITHANLYSINEPDGENNHGQEDSPVPVEATFSCRFYGFANRKPAYVMVVVNAPDKIYDQVITGFPGWTIDEVMSQVWEESGRAILAPTGDYHFDGNDPYDNMGFFKTKNAEGQDVRYFTMTNSTYVKNSEVHCAEEIPDDQITTDATAAKDLKPVTVYLERMVSKFSLALSFDYNRYIPTTAQSLDVCQYTYDESTKSSSFTYYDYPWAIRLLSWGMNGIETQNYIFKNVDKDGDWLTHTGWNSPSERRSFWSVDPHYTRQQGLYPWQYDDAKDQYDQQNQDWFKNKFHFYGNPAQGYSLTYYPLTVFCSGGENKGVDKEGNVINYSYLDSPAIIYTPENTFDQGLQVDPSKGTRAYELAGTHLLICAQLLLDPEGGSDYDVFNGNIYRNRVGVTYINDFSMFEDFVNAVNYKLRSQKNIYYKYYPWGSDETISSFHKEEETLHSYGCDFRTNSEGDYALFYRDPVDNKYYEITPYIINKFATDKNYMLSREADAINADGKVIPWIMYNRKGTGQLQDFEPLNLFIFNKDKIDEKIDGSIDEETNGYVLNQNTNLSDLRMTFQFRNESTTKWEDFKKFDDRDDNDLQSIFFEIWGVADCYNHGLMYYAIPVYAQEYTGFPASGDKKNLEIDNPDYNDPMFYYYYGVVRNNWYKFTLHSIGEPGYPVSVPNKPIVPNYVFKKDQVKVEMEILPMHVQDIEVPI